jgi:hypothetical protein
MRNLPGNPLNFPVNIRVIEDGDKRNATNLAAAIEDLTDRTAFLGNSVFSIAYTGLGGMTGMTNGAEVNVAGYGRYKFSTTTPSNFDPPLVVEAQGGGAWYHQSIFSLLNGTTGPTTIPYPLQIADRLLSSTALATAVNAIRNSLAFASVTAMRPLSSNWTYNFEWQQNATTVDPIDGDLDLARCAGRYIDSVNAYISGSASDTALPSGMPTLDLYQMSVYGGITLLGSKTDPTATVGDYKSAHPIHLEFSEGAAPLIGAYRYAVRLSGEVSTNSNSGLVLWNIVASLRNTP